MINQEDLSELRRLATNTYENDRAIQIHRVIRGVNDLINQVQVLQAENAELKSKLAAKAAKKNIS